MTFEEFNFEVTPLSTEDEVLVAAYERCPLPLDRLPYTEEFEQLVRDIEKNPADQVAMRNTFTRLLNLRKRGYLPRKDLRLGIL